MPNLANGLVVGAVVDHILRQIDHDRPGPARARNVKRFCYAAGEIVDILD